MRIREYSPADLDALKRLYAAQGFGYALPDLDSPLLITKLVLEEDDGSISMAVLLRLTAEAFLLHDPGRDAEPRGDQSDCHSESAAADEESLCLHNQDAECRGGEIPHPLPATAGKLRIRNDSNWTDASQAQSNRDAPRERWQRLLAMHEAVRRDAAARGLDDVSAFLPPRVARAFGRRLMRLGWRRDPWACYCRSVSEK